MSSERNSAWIARPKPVANPRKRLFCFPYAGGVTTIFHKWPAELPGDVEMISIALPGRSFRVRDEFVLRMQPLVDALEAELLPLLDRPFAFFGHSMGALVIWELAQQLARKNLPQPERLFVAGRRAPQIPGTRAHLHKLPHAAFVASLRDFYGTPEVVLKSPELQELVLPPLRADLELLETWSYVERPLLSCPITAYGGTHDEGVFADALQAWKEQTTGDFEAHFLPGGHFFLHGAKAELLGSISQLLAA